MTTQAPETLEALHLWLAEKLPELRTERCPHGDGDNGEGNHIWPLTPAIERERHLPCPVCQGRGWTPNVTTDALLEALRLRCEEVQFTVTSGGWAVWVCPSSTHEEAVTAHEALCLAARKALA